MSAKRVRSRFAIASICAFSLVAAACSDDETTTTTTAAPGTTTGDTQAPDTTTGDTAGEDTTTTEAAMVADGTEVVIGLVYSETGRSASSYNTVDDVANAWAEWVNTEMGGVGGHPVRIAAADGLSTGEGAAAAARQVVEEEGAVGVIIQDSTAENAIAEYLTTAGIPMIGGTANGRPSDSGEAHWPNTYFNTAPSNPSSAAATMVAAKAAGVTKFAAAVCAEVPACAEAGGLYTIVGPMVEVEYVGLATVGAADPSYTAPCLDLIGKGAEIINLGVASNTAVAVMEECLLQGYEGLFASASNSVVANLFETVEGLHMAGMINGFPWWADAPPAQAFRDALVNYGDDIDARNPSATTTWAALELFRKAVGENGPAKDADITAADVIDVYHAIDGETLDGLLPSPITYTTEGFQPLITCFWMFELVDGEFSTLTEGESGNGVEGDLQSSCFTLG
ncbi:MAG: ABC transporter substrate-binding protein [Actinomycetota bacterium]|nr:ABC transporter substrate-binding protein [Actinomycetota bacterium]